ncbi:hypothetical protein ACA910_021791 [Epithemia clementina (nom. ined.)]
MAWIPNWLRFDHAPSEATGLSLDNYARGHVMMSSMFLGPALLELASAAAQAQCTNNATTTTTSACKIHGFRPSSLLTNIGIFSGLLGSVSMPFIGAVVDHTPYRRHVAALSALLLASVKGVEVMVGPRTWFLVACLQVVSYVLYDVHAVAAYAYTFELTDHHHGHAHYNSFYNMVQYASMLIFLILVFGASSLLYSDHASDVATARLSQVVTLVVSLPCFVVAWKYFFRNRPALSQLPPGGSLWTCGFTKVGQTARRIVRDYRPLMWGTIAMMFAEAAMTAFVTIATTFLKEVLQMSANEIALVFLIVLLVGIPGSYLGGWLAIWLDSPVASAMICHVLLILTTTVGSLTMRGPEAKDLSYLFSALWGILIGWLSPVDVTIFMNLMPPDSQTEFMGIMSLSIDILAFLPALVFSILNEAGFNMAYGLTSLNLFFGIAMACLFQIGDYHGARLAATVSSSSSMTNHHHNNNPTTTILVNDGFKHDHDDSYNNNKNNNMNDYDGIVLNAGGRNNISPTTTSSLSRPMHYLPVVAHEGAIEWSSEDTNHVLI